MSSVIIFFITEKEVHITLSTRTFIFGVSNFRFWKFKRNFWHL